MRIDNSYLLETLKKAIQINSVIPHEEALAAFFADEVRKLGLEPEWHLVAPAGSPNPGRQLPQLLSSRLMSRKLR